MSKILIDEDTVKLALEAMEQAHDESLDENHFECRQILMGQIAALREALAEQPTPLFSDRVVEMAKSALAEQPAQRTWVGLTDEEIEKCYETTGHYQTLRPQDRFAVYALARAIEAKLKEKNNG